MDLYREILYDECLIDVLVSNAGICQFAEFLTMPHELWAQTRAVNLDGSFYIVQGTLPSPPPPPH